MQREINESRPITDLTRIPLYHGLTPQDADELRRDLHPRVFSSNTKIIATDQPSEVLYIILDGTVKIHIMRHGACDVILGFRGAGEVVGEMGVIQNADRSADATTIEATRVLWMDRDRFHSWCHVAPVIAVNMLGIMARRLRLASAQIESLVALDVYGRVAQQLLAFVDEYRVEGEAQTHIPLRLTQADLADMVGASRASVNKVLSDYKKWNYLSIDRKSRITVKDCARLRKRCA
jgi:CRP-like cAMP-binding protein